MRTLAECGGGYCRFVRSFRFLALGVALAIAAGSPAHATQEQTTFTVSATVIAACAVSASNLSFGNYNPTAASPTRASSDWASPATSCSTQNTTIAANATARAPRIGAGLRLVPSDSVIVSSG